MKIDWLRLENFKNLTNFEVDFSLESERQVVIGRNGVGKSNILEAIAWIFRDLDLAEESDFEYAIRYRCRGSYVKVVSKDKSTKKTKRKGVRKENIQRYQRKYWLIDDANEIKGKSDEEVDELFVELKESEFNKRNQPIKNEEGEYQFTGKRILPDYVFGYYSGISARFNEAFEDHERDYYDAQKSGEEVALRTMFLAKPHHSQFSLLSFFAQKDTEAEKFLKDEFDIEHLSSVLFKLQEPYWSSTSKKKALESEKEDRRFWGAGGKVAPFLESLFENSFFPMGGTERKEISFKQTKTVETRYCFLNGKDGIEKLADGLEAKDFFSRMESTIFSDLLSLDGEGLHIRVKLKGVKTPITFKEMSEGEQQLLTIIGLMRFTQQNESLFLLDEPDTHLNPSWCLDLLKNLRDYGVNPKHSQILITTHSPLTFAGLQKHEVVILDKDDENRISSYHPTTSPKGMSFSSLLTSQFFRIEAPVDKQTAESLERMRELSIIEKRTKEETQEFRNLVRELRNVDFSRTIRDPLYNLFIKAMTKERVNNKGLWGKNISEESLKDREDFASTILAKIRKSDDTH
ncbi:AAA family ATPase [Shewanella colwelliana]|uniref:AAA family ATPase n=1 Tax=Shewanella colwelliana TaxID=23 RepID=UPI003736A973